MKENKKLVKMLLDMEYVIMGISMAALFVLLFVASVPELEALPIAEKLFYESFGGLDPQVGYVCGQGNKLNALGLLHISDGANACSGRLYALTPF